MSDVAWKPIDASWPAECEETYLVEVGGALASNWHFRRVGKDVWLRIDEGRAIPLADLKNFGGLFYEPTMGIGVTDVVLAKPPMVYLLEAEEADAPLGLEEMTSGSYRATWFDLEHDRMHVENHVLDGGDEGFDPPAGCGEHVLLYLYRTSR